MYRIQVLQEIRARKIAAGEGNGVPLQKKDQNVVPVKVVSINFQIRKDGRKIYIKC